MTTIGLTRHAPGARLTPADQATLDAMADRGINATALRLGVGRGVVERLTARRARAGEDGGESGGGDRYRGGDVAGGGMTIETANPECVCGALYETHHLHADGWRFLLPKCLRYCERRINP